MPLELPEYANESRTLNGISKASKKACQDKKNKSLVVETGIFVEFPVLL